VLQKKRVTQISPPDPQPKDIFMSKCIEAGAYLWWGAGLRGLHEIPEKYAINIHITHVVK